MSIPEIREPEKMRKVLSVFSCLDQIRWESRPNYNLINYSHDDLTPDEKILAHWLCYIADRQMPFIRVWELGGYIISDMVRAYSRKRTNVRTIFTGYLKDYEGQAGKNGGKKSVGIACGIENAGKQQKERLRQIDEGLGSWALFSPRFQVDLLLMYRTLVYLDVTSHRSLGRFVSDAIKCEGTYREKIERLAAALNSLTYSDAPSKIFDNFGRSMNGVDRNAARFKPDYTELKRRHNKKRLWCALRDFLKSPEFNPLFVGALDSAGLRDFKCWRRANKNLANAMSVIELPGDVWNNSATFRRGLFEHRIGRSAGQMPEIIREVYNDLSRLGPLDFYPEQMDVSFDFVPRMCDNDRRMCDVCFFGEGISSICHGRKGKLCSVVMTACGYRHLCDPDRCRMKDIAVERTCKVWDAMKQ